MSEIYSEVMRIIMCILTSFFGLTYILESLIINICFQFVVFDLYKKGMHGALSTNTYSEVIIIKIYILTSH